MLLYPRADQVVGERIVGSFLDAYPGNHEVRLNAAEFYWIIGHASRARSLLEDDYRLFPNERTARILKRMNIVADDSLPHNADIFE